MKDGTLEYDYADTTRSHEDVASPLTEITGSKNLDMERASSTASTRSNAKSDRASNHSSDHDSNHRSNNDRI
jgi:hypothetical protein